MVGPSLQDGGQGIVCRTKSEGSRGGGNPIVCVGVPPVRTVIDHLAQKEPIHTLSLLAQVKCNSTVRFGCFPIQGGVGVRAGCAGCWRGQSTDGHRAVTSKSGGVQPRLVILSSRLTSPLHPSGTAAGQSWGCTAAAKASRSVKHYPSRCGEQV